MPPSRCGHRSYDPLHLGPDLQQPKAPSFSISAAMEDGYDSDTSDGDIFPCGLASQGCAVCGLNFRLLRCGSCEIVSYCGTTHQSAHLSKHKATCAAIRNSREALEREEAALRAHPGDSILPADVFNTGVGTSGAYWAHETT